MKMILDRILVAEIEIKESDLIIIESNLKYKKGVVLNTGKDAKSVKNGDLVFFDANHGVKVDFENKSYIILRDDDIFAVES